MSATAALLAHGGAGGLVVELGVVAVTALVAVAVWRASRRPSGPNGEHDESPPGA